MKIKFWDRLILFFGALLTVAAGAFLFISGLQFSGILGESLSVGARTACIVGGALLAVFGGYLFALPHSISGGRHDFIVQQTDNGELRIAVKAIENLVQKCVDMHEEITLDSMKIRNAREGVSVDLRISLANNISIPLAVASLQKQIKQYLVASSGIEVKEVRVSVETAGGETGTEDSPYMMPAEQAQEKPAAEQQKAKIPLHQRIFGRPEQPAIVPEPPKAQEEAAEEAAPEKAEEAELPAPEAVAEEAVENVTEQAEEASQAAEEALQQAEETAEETEIAQAAEDVLPPAEEAAEEAVKEAPEKEAADHE